MFSTESAERHSLHSWTVALVLALAASSLVEASTEAAVLETVVRGQVLDAARRPVRAFVEVNSAGASGGSASWFRTDPNGSFELTRQAPGRLVLSAKAESGYADPIEVELRPGQHVDVEIVLQAAAGIRGRVLGPDGQGVAGAQLLVESYRPGSAVNDESADARRGGSSSTVSDPAGSFLLDNLAEGAYRLYAEHPDFELLSEILEVAEGAVSEVELRFAQTRERLPVTGQVIDESGDAVAGAVVKLLDRSTPTDQAETFPDGRFELRAPRPAVYTVVVEHPRLAAHRSETFEVATGGVRDLLIELRRGAEVSGELRGLEPGELARVRVKAYHSKLWARRSAAVDGDGRYRLTGLAPGEWTVTAWAGGSRHAQGRLTLEAAADPAVLDLEFPANRRLTGGFCSMAVRRPRRGLPPAARSPGRRCGRWVSTANSRFPSLAAGVLCGSWVTACRSLGAGRWASRPSRTSSWSFRAARFPARC